METRPVEFASPGLNMPQIQQMTRARTPHGTGNSPTDNINALNSGFEHYEAGRGIYAQIRQIRIAYSFTSSFRMARQKAITCTFMQRAMPSSTRREEQLIQGPLLNHFGVFGQAEQQPVIRQHPAIWA